MKLICAWCNAIITDQRDESSAVSHGICDECASGIMSEPDGLIRTFLDQLEYPVLLVDSDSRMHLENNLFKELVGKSILEIEGKKSGEIFNCVHWKKTGLCGTSEHCNDCVINKTVCETFKTGKTVLDVEASLVISDEEDTEIVINSLISTQKVEEYVLLTIKEPTLY